MLLTIGPVGTYSSPPGTSMDGEPFCVTVTATRPAGSCGVVTTTSKGLMTEAVAGFSPTRTVTPL